MKSRKSFFASRSLQFELLEGRNLLATDFSLVEDLGQAPGYDLTEPAQLASWNGSTLFATEDFNSTTKIWSSSNSAGDETLQHLFRDSFAGRATELTPLGEKLLFNYTANALLQSGLWAINKDGSGAQRIGPTMVDPVIMGDKVFFYGQELRLSNGIIGSGLFRSDGTREGTVRIFEDNGPSELTMRPGPIAFKGDLYSVLSDRSRNRFLARINPETGEHQILANFPRRAFGRILTTSEAIIFSLGPSQQQLLVSYTPGAQELVELATARGYTVHRIIEKVGDRVFFPVGESELWSTDGTVAGTQEFLNSNYQNLSQRAIVNSAGDSFLFVAKRFKEFEYFLSDGTIEGTHPIGLKYPGHPMYTPLVVAGDAYYIIGQNPMTAIDALYEVEAKSGAVTLIYEIQDLRAQDSPNQFEKFTSWPAALNDRVFFVDRVDEQVVLLEYDQVAGEVELVSDVVGTAGLDYTFLDQDENYAWVRTDDNVWRITLATGTVDRVLFPDDEPVPARMEFAQIIGDKFIFFSDEYQVLRRWIVDVATHRVVKIIPQTTASVSRVVQVGTQKLQLRRNRFTHIEIHTVENDLSSSSLVNSIATPHANILDLEVWGNYLLFVLNGELWLTDGRPEGLQRIDGLDGPSKVISELQVDDSGNVYWFSDEFALYSLSPGSTAPRRIASMPEGLEVLGGSFQHANFHITDLGVIFLGATEAGGQSLYVARDGVTSLLARFELARVIGKVRDRVIVAEGTRSAGFSVWSTAGTIETTHRLHYTALGELFAFGPFATSSLADGRLLFRHFQQDTGYEIWTTDGSVAGTHLFADIATGLESSRALFVNAGNYLLASADTFEYGSAELFLSESEAIEAEKTQSLDFYVAENDPGALLGEITLVDVPRSSIEAIRLIPGEDANQIRLDSSSLMVSLQPEVAADFELQPTYAFTAHLDYRNSDGTMQTRVLPVRVEVIDILEDLTIYDQTFDVDENSPAYSYIGKLAWSQDARMIPRFYNKAGWPFTVDPDSGRIGVLPDAKRLDYENLPFNPLGFQVGVYGLQEQLIWVTINVRDVDEAPEFSGQETTLEVQARSVMTYAFPGDFATDPEGGSVSLRMVMSNGATLSDWIQFDPVSNEFTVSPTDRDVGVHSLTLIATDQGGLENFHPITVQVLATSDWHNIAFPLDVNNDGFVSPLDALIVINALNHGDGLPDNSDQKHFVDTNHDDFLTPIDALLVINFLNRNSDGVGEGSLETDIEYIFSNWFEDERLRCGTLLPCVRVANLVQTNDR